MDNININKIIDEVIYEMQYGKVDADIILFMKMHTNNSSHFEITPVLNLDNKELLYSKIDEYTTIFKNVPNFLLSDTKEKYLKRVITILFSNMSIDDFNDPCLYVQRQINFRNNRLLEDKSIEAPFFESQIDIEIEHSGKETPYCFSPTLVNGCNFYILPTISYGISDDTCYVYAIQDCNPHEKNPYHDKIKRKLYKLNSGVYDNESDEYKEYKSGGSEFYPENISDVSPGAVLSLTLFLNEVYKKGISKVKAISYLPIRYENKIKDLAKYTLNLCKQRSLYISKSEKEKIYLELINKQKYIQRNITEKFIRTFYRVAYHFSNVNIISLPMELDDGLHITLSEFERSNNEMLNEIINKSNNKTR